MSGFLIDQQLPSRLARYFTDHGYSAHHVKEYPGGSTLPDAEISRMADVEKRMVVTKDEDFRTTHLLSQKPDRLLHITCGNISTTDLLTLGAEYHDELMDAVETRRCCFTGGGCSHKGLKKARMPL